jgi:dTDP-4-amino-4,6-dideoxygalactose transaminase
MQFVDLQVQFKRLENEIRAGIDGVLQHGKYIMGPEVYELEERLADWAGVKHAITCSSGTDALLMPLMAINLGPGDAVFTTPFTFMATAEVISLLGATPVFVDIDPNTFNIDTQKLKLAIEAVKQNDSSIYPLPHLPEQLDRLNPKAIIPVDLFGLPADFDPIMEIADKENLFVLEDAAQGFGGVYKGRKAGSLGHAGAVSFFPAKPLGCYGDGGAILTSDESLADELRSIRVHGQGSGRYDNVRIGINGRLDSIQAAILLPKLRIFSREIQLRQKVAEWYAKCFNEMSFEVKLPSIPEHYTSAWAQYSILAEKRDEVQTILKEHDIPSMVYYPKGLHQQKAYNILGYATNDMPESVSISNKVLSLPMHPYLEGREITRICRIIGKHFA